MVIQVLMCYAAEMWRSPIMHEPCAYSQLQGNIIMHIRRQLFQKFPVRRPHQPLCYTDWTNRLIPNDTSSNIYWECGLMSCLLNGVWICTCPDMQVMEIKIPSRVNIAPSVNNSFHRNCGCWMHCSKHHWQNLTWQGKSSGLRPCTRCRWYGYSWSSCSILQTVLRWTPFTEGILWVLVPGLAATPTLLIFYIIHLGNNHPASVAKIKEHCENCWYVY
jgi:hypothetical protein